MKKRLVLIRHGKSPYDDYVLNDSERHLGSRGYQDVNVTAQWLIQNNYQPDLMITSPAIRAYSTCFLIANCLSFPLDKLVIHPSIYEATDAALNYVINELPNEANTVFLVGHNPSLTSMIGKLSNQPFSHLPTSAVAVIEFGEKLWKDISIGSGNLLEMFCSHKSID
ncbi:MAG: SixA phosphatase family protein [Bacteroidota bacterium]